MASYSAGSLVGLGLLEKDVNDDVLSWWFPSFDAAVDAVVRARSGLVDVAGGAVGGGVLPAATAMTSTPPGSPRASGGSFVVAPSSAPSFRCSRFGSAGGAWQYLLSLPVESGAPALSKVRSATVVLLANSYDVEKARRLLNALTKVSAASADSLGPLRCARIGAFDLTASLLLT